MLVLKFGMGLPGPLGRPAAEAHAYNGGRRGPGQSPPEVAIKHLFFFYFFSFSLFFFVVLFLMALRAEAPGPPAQGSIPRAAQGQTRPPPRSAA